MENTVFILGAGCSKEAGVPLMSEFMLRAREISYQKGIDQFNLVFEALEYLQRCHTKFDLDVYNLEAVYSALEMANYLGLRIGKYASKKVLREFTKLIIYTIQETTSVTMKNDGYRSRPVQGRPYSKLFQLMKKYLWVNGSRVDIVTFNYDLLLEYMFEAERDSSALEYSYGLDGSNLHHSVGLFKLHGSLNWIYANRQRSHIRAIPMEEVCHHHPNISALIEREGVLKEESSSAIIPPTWAKQMKTFEYKQVWRKASEAIQHADNLFVMGYSLPDTDVFVRYFLALSALKGFPLKKLWVFDPNGDVREKFDKTLGPGARKVYNFFQLTFSEALLTLGKLYEKPEKDRTASNLEYIISSRS